MRITAALGAGLLLLSVGACGSPSESSSDAQEVSDEASVQLDDAATEADSEATVDAEDPIWSDLKDLCFEAQFFTEVIVADVNDLEREANRLLRGAATTEGAEELVEPLQNLIEYVTWIEDTQLGMLSEDAYDAIMGGEEVGEALDGLGDLLQETNEIATVGANERTTKQVTGDEPPVTAKSIETDFAVACAGLP